MTLHVLDLLAKTPVVVIADPLLPGDEVRHMLVVDIMGRSTFAKELADLVVSQIARLPSVCPSYPSRGWCSHATGRTCQSEGSPVQRHSDYNLVFGRS